MSESSEIVSVGTSAPATAALDALAVASPVEEGGGGTTPEGLTLGRESQLSNEQPST